MDSPVIMDTVSEFGRTLDPGFPFEDQSFSRFGDIRSQLDNLASRHPEFAEHLLGPPWGDIPLHGTLRNRRRGSGSGNSNQGHPDEDARSQASGSSAASAASGASGVSSHGESVQVYQPQKMQNKIPQYGLRNTVDIGQHNHSMDNGDKVSREQRSASAPPENRQQNKEEVNQQQQQPQGNQRFVSRVEITPQFNQQTDDVGAVPKVQQQQQQQKQQKPQQQQSNVRHIPIFVEGRDEPVIPKNVEEPTIRRESPLGFYSTQFDDSSSKFHNPAHFQRPSTFNHHFSNRQRDWSPHFQDSFNDVFDHPNVRRTSQPTQTSSFRRSRQPQQPQQHYERHPQPNEFTCGNTQTAQPQSQSAAAPVQQPEVQQEPKKKVVILPKDPLERVALVQKEVDSLTEQILVWNGNSKTDKQYIYLDEMLTRELIKLDDIETEGKDNVRQARKQAIKSIQDSISLLETKVSSTQPLANQSQSTDAPGSEDDDEKKMNITTEPEINAKENKTAIPLPAVPSSPTKDSAEQNIPIENVEKTVLLNDQTTQPNKPNSVSAQPESTPATKISTMEVEQNNLVATDKTENNQTKSEKVEATEIEETATIKAATSPKKLKKTKKQPPISTEPIPLPSVENNCLNAK